jgi:hypothetical protein
VRHPNCAGSGKPMTKYPRPIGHKVAVRQCKLKWDDDHPAPIVTACRGGGEAAVRRRGGLRK